MKHDARTALVTGANSGLGFEAGAQLAEAGYSNVILACRTLEKVCASPPGKLVGPMEVQPQSHFYDRSLQDAAWRSVVRLSGVGISLADPTGNELAVWSDQ